MNKHKFFLSTIILLCAHLSFAQTSINTGSDIVKRNDVSATLRKIMDTTIYGRNDKVGKYINTRGFKMYYETYGEVAPLLMIHGNGGSINNFICQIPYFSKSYKVIVPDSRAQGKSTDKGESLSYEMMTDDLNALLDSLHLDSCYVIGVSDGGIEGLLLAMRHPDKVKNWQLLVPIFGPTPQPWILTCIILQWI